MKYPASRMMGGSMKRKKTLGVNVEGGCSEVRKRRNPMMIPTTIRRQDSGKMWCSFGVMWKPEYIFACQQIQFLVACMSMTFHAKHVI